jgi:hypothetical protein
LIQPVDLKVVQEWVKIRVIKVARVAMALRVE